MRNFTSISFVAGGFSLSQKTFAIKTFTVLLPVLLSNITLAHAADSKDPVDSTDTPVSATNTKTETQRICEVFGSDEDAHGDDAHNDQARLNDSDQTRDAAAVDSEESRSSIASDFLIHIPEVISENQELHPLFSQPHPKLTRAATAPPMTPLDPEDLAHFFVVEEPEDRTPASAAGRGKKPTRNTSRNSSKKGVRHSKLPASVVHGLEFRTKHEDVVSVFWVAKRGHRYDLIFSNSSGSRSSIGLSVENFLMIHEFAAKIRPVNDRVNKCPKSIMQVHILIPGRPERTLTSCVNGKSKSANELRELAALLARFIS